MINTYISSLIWHLCFSLYAVEKLDFLVPQILDAFSNLRTCYSTFSSSPTFILINAYWLF